MSQQIRPGMTSAQIRAMSSGKGGSGEDTKKLFKPDVIYTLSRIYKQEDDVIYKFTSSEGIVNAPFKSVTAAERFISDITGDDLPDYSNVYKSMTD